MAGFYAAWHGADGLRRIASRINFFARLLADAAVRAGHTLRHTDFFDTITLDTPHAEELVARALTRGYNLRRLGETAIAIALDETVTIDDLNALAGILCTAPRRSCNMPCSANIIPNTP